MSMREYGVNDYVLLLTDDTMKLLASEICEDFSEAEYAEDKYSFNEVVEEKIGSEYISEFSGDAVQIRDDGTDDWFSPGNYEAFSGNTIYYIPFYRYPNLFSAAYKNMSEIVDEMKRRVGEYLPHDFAYRDAIRHIVGTYYG